MLSAAYDILGPQGHSNNVRIQYNLLQPLSQQSIYLFCKYLIPNAKQLVHNSLLHTDILPNVYQCDATAYVRRKKMHVFS